MVSDNFTTNLFLDREVGPGVQPVLALFQSAGLDGPKYDAVRKWRERESMPALWFAKVLHALEIVEGRHVPMSAYFNTPHSDEALPCSLKERLCSTGSPPSVFD